MILQFELQTMSTARNIEVNIQEFVIAGWAGRDRHAIERTEARLDGKITRIECVVVGGRVKTRSILTTEGDGTIVARQSDELLAGVQAAGANAAVDVRIETVLEREHRFQAVAQGFFALEAEAISGADAGDATEGILSGNLDSKGVATGIP